MTLLLQHLLNESGLSSLWHSCRDTKLLCAQRMVRMYAYGGSTLLLAAHLSNLGNTDQQTGIFMALTLVGDILISMFLTLYADRLGRRRILLLGSAMMCFSGLVFATSETFAILVMASVFGVISPSGNECGPFRAIEESTLAQLTHESVRSDIYAWYTLLGIGGQSLGILSTGFMTRRLLAAGYGVIPAYKAIFYGYAAIGALKFWLTWLMSDRVEAPTKTQQRAKGGSSWIPHFRQDTVYLTMQLCSLFGMDSFASGVMSPSWLTYFFQRKFNVEESQLGGIFSISAGIAAFSVLIASAMSKRFGNVRTMVFGHLPSSIALLIIPLPSQLRLAMAFLFFRDCFKNTDTAPRAALMAAIIPADERTAIMGTINMVKIFGQTLGPLVTGSLAHAGHFSVAFFVAGGIKASFDLTFLLAFGHREKSLTQQQGREAAGDDAIDEDEVALGLLDDSDEENHR